MRRNPLPKSKDNEPIQFIDQINRDESFNNAYLENANLKGSDFTGCSFRNADLRNAILVDCDFTDCDFTDADLSGAVLVGATVKNANFDNCLVNNTMLFDIKKLNTVKMFTPIDYDRLGGFVFDGLEVKDDSNDSPIESIEYAMLLGFQVLNKDVMSYKLEVLNKLVFDYVFNLQALNFAKGRDILIFNEIKDYLVSDRKCFCFLKHSPFKNLKGVNLEWADLRSKKINLKGADLRYTLFNHATLTRVDFEKANLEHASFKEANLTRSLFKGANLKNANFEEANLTEAIFYQTDADNANFTGVDFTDADISFSDFFGAKFEGAWFHNTFIEKDVNHNNGIEGLSREQLEGLYVKCDECGIEVTYGDIYDLCDECSWNQEDFDDDDTED